eukprot:XP_024303130.1 uncharacterized protein LOC101929400 isoform X3 [Homo sapiens]
MGRIRAPPPSLGVAPGCCLGGLLMVTSSSPRPRYRIQSLGHLDTELRRNSPRVLSSLGFPTTSKSWKTQGAGRAPEPWPALPAAPKPLASPEAGMAGPGGRRTTSLPKRRGWGCSWRGEAHSPRTARTGRTRRGQAGRRPAPRQVATAEDSYGNTLFEEPMKQCQAGTRISSDFFEEESPFLHSQAMSEWIKKNRVPFYEILSA